MQFLLFRLYGPLSSWGSTAVGEKRPSDFLPSKSSIIGLICAAIGIPREKHKKIFELSESIGVGVRVDSSGCLITDFHTIQTAPAQKNRFQFTRKAELSVNQPYTITSSRDYRMDAAYAVALWKQSSRSEISLEEVKQGLQAPVFQPYLGRKSCPPTLPFNPKLMNVETLREAFDECIFEVDEFISDLERDAHTRFCWDILPESKSGMKGEFLEKRRDMVLSRRHWTFQEREVAHCLDRGSRD